MLGKIIYPLQCRGQDEGAAIFGLGQALFEDLVYENGQLLNPNLVDYRLPRFRDLPGVFETIIWKRVEGAGSTERRGWEKGLSWQLRWRSAMRFTTPPELEFKKCQLRGEKLLEALQAQALTAVRHNHNKSSTYRQVFSNTWAFHSQGWNRRSS